jgi:hypothetical protein
LFTRFPPPPTALTNAAQIERARTASHAIEFPTPPSEKHSSLLSEILAVTRESYQARKESQEQSEDSAAEKTVIPIPPRAIVHSTGRAQRASMVGSRQVDPSLHVIHEDEAVTANLPLTSESLRELDRMLTDRSTLHNETNMVRTRSDGDVTLRSQRMPVALPAAVRTTTSRQNVAARRAPESLDNISVATSTTLRPSFHGPQLRQPAMQSDFMRTITHQPSRSAILLRPVRSGNSQQRNDELPEGIFHDEQESSAICVCLGRCLW